LAQGEHEHGGVVAGVRPRVGLGQDVRALEVRPPEMTEDTVRIIREQGFTAGVLAERAGIEFGYMAAELDTLNDGFATGWQMARQADGAADTPAPR
jgi:hypothetical protein